MLYVSSKCLIKPDPQPSQSEAMLTLMDCGSNYTNQSFVKNLNVYITFIKQPNPVTSQHTSQTHSNFYCTKKFGANGSSTTRNKRFPVTNPALIKYKK